MIVVKPEIEYIKNKELRCRNIISVFSQILIAVALYVVCYHLFYRQSIGGPGNYQSDLPLHISAGIKGESYSFLIKLVGIIATNVGNEGVAAFESGMVVLTWYFAKRLIDRISGFQSVISIYASLGLIFLTNIHLSIFDYYYSERVVSQPWHNITYIGMRLFAVLTIGCFIDLYKNYMSKILWKNYCFVLFFLLISACVKPNFFISFSAALLVALIVDFIKHEKTIENLRKYFIIGSVVFPSCAVLFIQSRVLYPSGFAGGNATDSGIQLVWFADFFNIGIGKGILKIFLCLSFPAIVFIVNKGGDTASRFVGLFFLVSQTSQFLNYLTHCFI